MKKQKGFIVPVLVGIITILLIGAGAYIYRSKQKVTSIDNISNLNTYQSKYGFSFQYPKDFVVTHEDENRLSIANSINCKINEGGELSSDNCLFYDVFVQKNKIVASNAKSILIDGISGESLNSEGVEENGMVQSIYQVFIGGNWIIQQFTIKSSNQIVIKQLESIRSSFKWTISTTTDETINSLTEKQIGLIKNVYQKDNKYYLDIDYIQFLTGLDGLKAKIEDRGCEDSSTATKELALKELSTYPDDATYQKSNFGARFPQCSLLDGYYIRNQSTQIRTLEIDPNAEVRTTNPITSDGTFESLMYNPTGDNGEPVSTTSFSLLFKAFNGPSNLLTGNHLSQYKYIHYMFNIYLDKTNKVVKLSEQFVP